MSVHNEYDVRRDIAYQLTPEERQAIAESLAGAGAAAKTPTATPRALQALSESELQARWLALQLLEGE